MIPAQEKDLRIRKKRKSRRREGSPRRRKENKAVV